MVQSATTRLQLPQWSTGNPDTLHRADLNGAFAEIEANVALFSQGTLAARPQAKVIGRFYAVVNDTNAANNGLMFYDTGSAWIPLGNTGGTGNKITAANAQSVALVIQGATGQSAHLMEWQDDQGNVLAFIGSAGTASFTGVALGSGTEVQDLTVDDMLVVHGPSTLKDTNVAGTLQATNFVSGAQRQNGTPKTNLASDGSGWMDALIPPGTILATGCSSAPTNYLMCFGQSVNRNDYKDLFAAIGTAFGSSDNSTFNLPDMRGKQMLGAGAGVGSLGSAGGTTFSHGHSHQINPDTANIGTLTINSANTGISIQNDGAHTHGASTGAAGGHTPVGNAQLAGDHSHSLGGFAHDQSSNTTATGSSNRLTSPVSHTHSVSNAGTHNHTLNMNAVPDHTHSVTVNSDGTHSHQVTDNGHTHTVSSSQAGTHNHGGATGTLADYVHPFVAVNYMIRT